MNVKAVEYVGRMPEGWSKPHLIRCDDGNQYVVKLMNNPQGLKVLPNEMIAYRLGRLLDLPVGKCAVVHISEELINSCPLKDKRVKAGPHLGSLYYKKAKVLQDADDLKGCYNLGKAAGMIAFDHWIQNWDRCWDKARNILVLQDRSKFVMIDHANAFTGHWTIDSLKQNRTNATVYWGKFYELFVPYIDGDQPFKKMVRKIDSLSREDLWTAMDDLPPEWQVPDKELNKLVKYLEYRKSAVAEALYKLKKHFPQWNRA